jgi:hypothetical protein
MPSIIRPRISVARFTAAMLRIALMGKLMPPQMMLAHRL